MAPKFSEINNFACGREDVIDAKLTHQAFDLMKQDIHSAVRPGATSSDTEKYPEGQGILAIKRLADGTTESAHLDKYNGVISAQLRVPCPGGSPTEGVLLFDGQGNVRDRF